MHYCLNFCKQISYVYFLIFFNVNLTFLVCSQQFFRRGKEIVTIERKVCDVSVFQPVWTISLYSNAHVIAWNLWKISIITGKMFHCSLSFSPTISGRYDTNSHPYLSILFFSSVNITNVYLSSILVERRLTIFPICIPSCAEYGCQITYIPSFNSLPRTSLPQSTVLTDVILSPVFFRIAFDFFLANLEQVLFFSFPSRFH